MTVPNIATQLCLIFWSPHLGLQNEVSFVCVALVVLYQIQLKGKKEKLWSNKFAIQCTFCKPTIGKAGELSYPSITFCQPSSVYRDIMTSECNLNSSSSNVENFLELLKLCLEANPDLELSDLMNELKAHINSIEIKVVLNIFC